MIRFGDVADLTAARDLAITNDLKNGGRVLVIGHAAKRLLVDLQDHPRIVIWNDDYLSRHPAIPSNVRVVFMTTKIGHAVTSSIVKQCSRMNVRLERFSHNVGEIRKSLEVVLGALPGPAAKKDDDIDWAHFKAPKEDAVIQTPIINPAAAAAAAPTNGNGSHEKTARGGLKAFVEEAVASGRINLAMPRGEIVEKLWKDVSAKFPVTTKDSLGNTVYILKNAAPKPPTAEATKRFVSVAAPKPLIQPAALVDVSARTAPTVLDGDDDVARLLVDAIERMQLALASYREELRKADSRVKDKVRKMLEELS